MPSPTETLAALVDLDALLTVAELEQAQIRDDHASGLTPEGMNRPLFDWERHTNFAAMDQALDRAYGRAQAILSGLQDVIVQELVQRLDGLSSPGDLADAIRDFGATQPVKVRAAINAAIDDLVSMLLDLHEDSARRMLTEVTIAGAAIGVAAQRAASRRPPRWKVEGMASAPTTLLWQRVTQVAAQANTPDADVRAVVKAVQGAKVDGALDQARQASHVASGEGRKAVAETVEEPSSAYAAEILDRATCGPCRAVDGKRYDKLRDAVADYPGLGPYKFCEGGSRCRGTVVLQFNEAEPTLP